MKLMLKWPGLHYCTSAFAPKHYPKAIIDYANTRGADKIIYAGYFPMGLTLDRIMGDMPNVRVHGRRVAEVPARERGAGAQAHVTEGHAQLARRRAAHAGAARRGARARARRSRSHDDDVHGARVRGVRPAAAQRPVQVLGKPRSNFGDRPYLRVPRRDGHVRGAARRAWAGRRGARRRVRRGQGRPGRVRERQQPAPYALVEWAAVSLGAIIVGLNGWWTGPELVYGVELTTPTVLIGDRPAPRPSRRGRDRDRRCRSMDLATCSREPSSAAETESLPTVAIDEDDPFMILFTSGTTGRPKGATLSHRNLVHMGSAMAFGRRHDVGCTGRARRRRTGGNPASICGVTVLPHLGHRAAVHDRSAVRQHDRVPAAGPLGPRHAPALTAEHRVSGWSGVPTQLLAHARAPRLRLASTCRACSRRRRRAARRSRPSSSACSSREDPRPSTLSNGYGMSESMGVGTVLCGRAELHAPRVGRRAVPTMRGPDPRRRRAPCCPRARSARSACAARVVLLGLLGRSRRHRRRCSTPSAGTTAVTTAASTTACSGSRVACVTSSSAAARTSTRWRSSTG